jgi:hypothetical protein
MNKRGIVVIVISFILIGISLSLAASVIPSTFDDPDDLSLSSLFEGVFDEISDEIQIMPGDTIYVSYGVFSQNVPFLWGIQILDYTQGDELSINISNIFGDNYGKFVQTEPILFESLNISQPDTLNFEIQNIGTSEVLVVTMFSENPENSDIFTDSNSPVNNMIFPLIVSGMLLIFGIIILIIGVIILLVDLKNYQTTKRKY